MHWRKIGRIFDPASANSAGTRLEFAQAPQALVFDTFVRVYFSTRTRDGTGKYLSHIAFADFDKEFQLLGISREPVMDLGKLGCFDEHGIFPLNVLRVGGKLYGYIGGWSRRVSVSVDGSIGVATSQDQGMTFQRLGDGPVLTASPNEPFLIGDPFVQVHDGMFHMWYIFGVEWKRFAKDEPPDRVYRIGHAVSRDGMEWVKEAPGRKIISERLGPDESQALPTVTTIDGLHHMLFCYRQSSDFRRNSHRAYRIGHAFSSDLQEWTRDDSALAIDVTAGAWDAEMLCYPHLFTLDGAVHLLYNGNEFGRYGFGIAKLER